MIFIYHIQKTEQKNTHQRAVKLLKVSIELIAKEKSLSMYDYPTNFEFSNSLLIPLRLM